MEKAESVINRFWNLDVRHCSFAFVVAIAVVIITGCDEVVVNNTSGNAVGILVDGRIKSGQVNDKSFTSNNTNINVSKFKLSAMSNEVVAYTNQRPVTVKSNVPWTNGDDSIQLTFPNQITIPVKVWIVKGPFNTQRLKAIGDSVITTDIWNSERMGVAFSQFEIVDATGDPDASNYFAFDCSKKTGIEADIGKTAGRINIYYVETVDGGSGRGQACSIGSDFVAMGENSGIELLVHELGHDFDLTHINDLVFDFDQTNIMLSASNSREFVTESQIFRAHLSGNSAINFLYSARPGLPVRNCSRDDASDQCPEIKKRIWADGAYPSN